MEPFSKHTGLVVPLDRVNVDTDQVIPKQFLKFLTRHGYGNFLFNDWRYQAGNVPNPDFVLNVPRYQGGSILLARANFGCGSSREHAAWALLDYGFRALIAPSFGDIFFSNSLKNGLLLITLPEAQIDELFLRTESTVGYQLTADLQKQSLADSQGLNLHFDIEDVRKQVLLEGLDDIGMTLKHDRDIATYEKNHHPGAPLYAPVDSQSSPGD